MQKKLVYSDVKAFFNNRSKDSGDLCSTMLQKDFNIAMRRDLIEKDMLLGLEAGKGATNILDLGCGNGRLAELFNDINNYVGVDFSEALISQATAKNLGVQYHFYMGSVAELPKILEIYNFRYDFIIISGLLIYLNDEDVETLILEILKLSSPKCRIYLREPVSVLDEKLSLIDHYSKELNTSYNAIYRTEKELLSFLHPLCLRGFKLIKSDWMYKDPSLNNRKETMQKYFYLEIN
jgi:SAM-dependent methyltransferase